MSLRALLEAKLRRAVASTFDELLPGSGALAAELVDELGVWERERAPIVFPAAADPVSSARDNGAGDTVAVEILDPSGRSIGWTTATTKR